MDTKVKFTRLIAKASELAKEKVQPISSEEVVDGAGAIIANSKGEYGYDLRPLWIKGLLPPSHPVRLASELNLDPPITELNLTNFCEELGFKRCKLIKRIKTPLAQFLPHSNPKHFLPEGAQEKSYVEIPLEGDIALALGQSEAVFPPSAQTYDHLIPAGYFEFAQRILINNSRGRIAEIEKLIKQSAPPDWQVSGTWIFVSTTINKLRFQQAGLLVVSENYFAEKEVAVNIPVSIYDKQIKDITARMQDVLK